MSSRPLRLVVLGFCIIITFFFIAPRLLDGTDVQEILNTQRLEFLRSENIASYVHKPWESSSTKVDWSRFAYTQYATNKEYLCNSVMVFEALNRLHSKAERLLMFPQEWAEQETLDQTTDLLRKARSYGAKLQPIDVLRRTADNPRTAAGELMWSESFTKLLAFNQTQYDRILSLDSDSTILQNMDELFLAPHAPVGAPRGYWLNREERILSSQLLLVEPSDSEFGRIMKAVENRGPNDYDMDIVTNLYRDNAMILPHRLYDLITGELRVGKDANHAAFLGREEEKWDADKVIREAKFVHFSDWPINKPWQETPEEVLPDWVEMCTKSDGKEDYACGRNRDIWRGLFADFRQRRKVCEYLADVPVVSLG
ncbi:MAG: N-acetylglucosaminyltransferase [Candelina submexicana]|nr:MAG: N-acetylglucosaminyltransferase [Candelina submexicana]